MLLYIQLQACYVRQQYELKFSAALDDNRGEQLPPKSLVGHERWSQKGCEKGREFPFRKIEPAAISWHRSKVGVGFVPSANLCYPNSLNLPGIVGGML